MGCHAGPQGDSRRSLSSVSRWLQDAKQAGARRSGQRPTGGGPPPRRATLDEKDAELILRGLRLVRLRDRVGGGQADLDPPAPPTALRVAHGKDRLRGGSEDQAPDAAGPRDAAADADPTAGEGNTDESGAATAKGHGRNGAAAYRGAERIDVPHPSLRAGDPCPACGEGTVYDKAPGVLVRITGQPPLAAKIYQLQKLRCHLCGQVFTADAPAEAGPTKYDATAGSMIGLLKYGSGLPFNRLEGLQGDLGVPLPASTQWDVVEAVAGSLAPVLDELIRQAAQGEVLHNDDTTVKILELMGERARQEALADAEDDADERRGLFTSGVVALCDGVRLTNPILQGLVAFPGSKV